MEETNLKVRLVGATVLVSLAVIFIPMILDGRESVEADITSTNIPPKPESGYISKVIPLTPVVKVKPATTEKPVIKKGLAALTIPEEQVVQEKTTTTVAKKSFKAENPVATVTTIQKLRPGLSAWAVQVGSFSSKKNAFALRDKLRKKGFSAFVDTAFVKDIPNFRVRVGPELKRELAEALRKKLASTYKGRTIIVKHPS